jgi:hypothetical protein
MSISDRLTYLIKNHFKTDYAKFARSISLSKTSLSNLNTDWQPGFRFFDNISKTYPEINMNWLIRGDGEMLLGEHAQPQSTTPKEQTISNDPEIAALQAIIQNHEAYIAALQATISDKTEIISLLRQQLEIIQSKSTT